MEYLSVAQARERRGLRLVLTAGVPGPWGEAAKAVLRRRRVEFAPVAQQAMAPNEELLAWTGHRNAPIAMLDDEPPRTTWLEIVLLAERLGQGPSLLPAEAFERALCLGWMTELAGPDGLGWNRRVELMAGLVADPAQTPPAMAPLVACYGVTPDAVRGATRRMAAILQGLTAQLARQQAGGSPFLVGRSLTALDLYWACFSMMLAPLPQDVNPMPEWLRPMYSGLAAEVAAALDPALLAHRDRIYAEHIGLPLDY